MQSLLHGCRICLCFLLDLSSDVASSQQLNQCGTIYYQSMKTSSSLCFTYRPSTLCWLCFISNHTVLHVWMYLFFWPGSFCFLLILFGMEIKLTDSWNLSEHPFFIHLFVCRNDIITLWWRSLRFIWKVWQPDNDNADWVLTQVREGWLKGFHIITKKNMFKLLKYYYLWWKYTCRKWVPLRLKMSRLCLKYRNKVKITIVPQDYFRSKHLVAAGETLPVEWDVSLLLKTHIGRSENKPARQLHVMFGRVKLQRCTSVPLNSAWIKMAGRSWIAAIHKKSFIVFFCLLTFF